MSELHSEPVVTKHVPPEFARKVNADQFAREMTKPGSLDHPNIIPVRESGTLDDGTLYYSMSQSGGETLRDRLAREKLPLADAITVLRDVARALDAAHARGVIHGNLNPENVVLLADCTRVSDFGVVSAIAASRSTNDAPSLKNTTSKFSDLGLGYGTPAYMAPEQAMGATNLDARADIYAFGCMAYELFAGGPPFGSRASGQLLMAHVSKAPQPLESHGASVPKAMGDLIMACLRKKPADRPQTARELVTTLEQPIPS